ncbi:MAG: hypothetical protein CMD58_04055 [Gammaproteobacteria bacterium]|nr:hypothetical protein [Gammaproteobacteria bacterium]
MIWVIRLYLLFMAITYTWIGIWALFDPLFAALELGYPSFFKAVGLSPISEIGYSEIAGLYGGLNLCIGIMCLIGIFKKSTGIFATKFITFLVGSIALGRFLFAMLPTTPTFWNDFFIFEVTAFLIGVAILYFINRLENS